ncbi:MAG: sugar phosphate isomerase/epimerase [Planctomycetaceae bacterium]|jgi:sugar phosphate isomerase/epimerase|nr:sugar phosphate isomerase/epimerase [Planctomycetaceae bacterium]
MLVAASTSCILNAPLADILDRLADLEYTCAELVIGENGVIKPEEVLPQFDSIVHLWRTQRRISPVAVYFDLDPTAENYVELFRNVCQLAKAVKIVVITVRASVPGTPFNEEIERLRFLTNAAMNHGVVVGLATESGRLAESPDTIGSICKNVQGLGITLDPSHFIYNYPKPKDYESIMSRVCHLRLRDTSSTQFQTRIGQGTLEFGRLVLQLNKVNYRRALCVDLAPLRDVDTFAELRKMRLLLESLL